MTLKDVRDILQAEVLNGEEHLDREVAAVGASDLMSDVLAFGQPGLLLLTGLANVQAVRTADIIEAGCLVYVRGKRPDRESVELAAKKHLPLLATALMMFPACGRLYEKGLRGLSTTAPAPLPASTKDEVLTRTYEIAGGDFNKAGRVSIEIKEILQELGIHPTIIRRTAIAAYEAEMNIVMYAPGGELRLDLSPLAIVLEAADRGPGIPDIDKAMVEGFSTATPEMREMGFGAGMGLPNIKRNSDDFNIESAVGRGTKLRMVFRLHEGGAGA